MMLDRCDGSDRAPTCTAIRGIKGAYSGLVGVINRHNHGTIRAHNRLSPNDSGIIGLCGAPCLASIRRGTHLEQVAGSMIIPFCVTVAVEGTCRRIVTNDPVLIQITPGSCRDGITPCETT